jgi:FlaG/FlaF family flagellin (archaellin)
MRRFLNRLFFEGLIMLRICVFAKWARILLCALTVGIASAPIGSAATETNEATAQQAEQTPVAIAGFRSATFGMDKAAVIAAIAKDFGVDEADIAQGQNTVERTDLLTVQVPDLLEGGGTAQVSYIFGYTSKALIQVGASWNATIDPAMTDKQLVANSDVLSSHFLAGNYAAGSLTTATAVANGILLFRGLDTEGHSAILLLQGNFEENTDGLKALKPTGLALLYSVNPDTPDIFRIKDGNF